MADFRSEYLQWMWPRWKLAALNISELVELDRVEVEYFQNGPSPAELASIAPEVTTQAKADISRLELSISLKRQLIELVKGESHG